MQLKKLSEMLLVRVVVAIILGIVCSFIFPTWLARIFTTFNGLFGSFLNFFVPVLIFALITPAIAGLGRGAGKWLGLTTLIAYGSTVLAGVIAFVVAKSLYPWLLGGQELITDVADIDEGGLSAYFTIEIAPPFEVLTALILAFCVGLAMTAVKSDTLYTASREFEAVVMKVISAFVIPLLPVFIFGIFLGLGMNDNLGDTMLAFGKVLVLAVVMTLLYLLVQYLIAGAVSGRNPFKALATMSPAYATALGTSSSAATIPVTLRAAIKNNIDERVAGFVIPLCATIHLSGSMMKITLFAIAVVYMGGLDVSTPLWIGFILMLAVTMVAAPGVPGGAIMAAVGVLSSMLGFTDAHIALMIAAYIVIDSFGTAANVTGDGAIAMVMNRIVGGKAAEEIKQPA